MKKKSIDSVDVRGRRVLVRVDFNVPMKSGAITDDMRIRESLPTIRRIVSGGGKAILMSHLGRPKGRPKPEFSLEPVARRLGELLGHDVAFAPDCVGPTAAAAVSALKEGGVLLLENLRYHPEEEANDPGFSRQLAELGDLYVNDAFGTAHRAHASTEGVTHVLSPAVAGYLLMKELEFLGKAVENPVRPYVAIIGGAKISGKIDVITHLLHKVDSLLIGGGMMFTFYRAQGLDVGKSLVEEDKIPLAAEILKTAASKKVRFLLPVDCVIAEKFENQAKRQTVPVNRIIPGWMGLDIGDETIKLYDTELNSAATVVWNGPMGVFEMENFAKGTVAVAKALAVRTAAGATTIVGGGDSAAALNKLGYEKKVSHVSTGGGASLEFLEGRTLPGVAALTEA
ncbi:MAG TPA: phosphoglycerate kinase [Bacteroidota bacterium]|nr:phosphoglycerate kinase [Bacteroidota bacterium]